MLTCLYDAGIAFGVLGVIAGLVLLLSTISGFIREAFAQASSPNVSEGRMLFAKRDYGSNEVGPEISSSLALSPIVRHS